MANERLSFESSFYDNSIIEEGSVMADSYMYMVIAMVIHMIDQLTVTVLQSTECY